MPGKFLYEYAVIRLVPRVHREEFVNVGVIVYCKEQNFLAARCTYDHARLSQLSADTEINDVIEHLNSLCRICKGGEEGGAIGKLGLPERFRWLTAIRSTIVQTSRVHPGYCDDAAATLDKLFTDMVQ